MKFNSYKHRFAPVCMALAIAAGSISAAVAKEGGSRPQSRNTKISFSAKFRPRTTLRTVRELGVIGEVEIVRERYADGKVRIERQVTLNGDGNYVNHGAWKIFAQTGDVVAEGQYNFGQRGRRCGPAGSAATIRRCSTKFPFKQFKPPFMSQANFTDGKMDGDWIITDANDRKVAMLCRSRRAERNGPATIWLPNGKVFRQMTYQNRSRSATCSKINPKTGEVAEAGTYDDGRKVVTKTEHYPGNRQAGEVGDHVPGRQDGRAIAG